MGNIDILEQPNRIYNCDKTGFLMAPCPTKVIASKGDPPHMYQQGASTKAQITVLLAASATTHYIPHHLSRAKFLSYIYRGVLQKFAGCSVWTLALRVDGPGPVLQLARAKLHPPNQKTSCSKAGTAIY